MNKRQAKQAVIEAGREYLKHWLNEPIERGAIYYQVAVTSSGMTRYIKLYRVTPAGNIDMLWPGFVEPNDDTVAVLGGYGEALTVIAKDWDFDFKRRAFVVKGCRMNMVAHLVETLGNKAGIDDVLTHVRLMSLGWVRG